MKFRLNNRIEVVGGFYKGQSGVILSVILGFPNFWSHEYLVRLDSLRGIRLEWLPSRHLK